MFEMFPGFHPVKGVGEAPQKKKIRKRGKAGEREGEREIWHCASLFALGSQIFDLFIRPVTESEKETKETLTITNKSFSLSFSIQSFTMSSKEL